MKILSKAIGLSLCLAIPGVALAADDPLGPPPDITRKELATALINYEAKARLKDYELSTEKYFMMAPGSPSAIKAGEDVGAEALKDGSGLSTTQSNAIQISEGAISEGKHNMAEVMQNDVVSRSKSQGIINIITNPEPKGVDFVDPDSGSVPNQAGIDKAVTNVLLSVAGNALGEIAAKREVNSSSNKSLTQVLHDESERRFTSLDWYKNVGVSSDTSLLRELAQMEAFSLVLQHQNYRLQEQNVSLLAALLSSMAKMTATMNALNKAMGEMESVDLEDIDTGDIEVPDL